MIAEDCAVIEHEAQELSYENACLLAQRAAKTRRGGLVVICLTTVRETTTAALARLVALRRDLVRAGGDLCLVGLEGKAEALFRISGVYRLLPRKAVQDAESATVTEPTTAVSTSTRPTTSRST